MVQDGTGITNKEEAQVFLVLSLFLLLSAGELEICCCGLEDGRTGGLSFISAFFFAYEFTFELLGFEFLEPLWTLNDEV